MPEYKHFLIKCEIAGEGGCKKCDLLSIMSNTAFSTCENSCPENNKVYKLASFKEVKETKYYA